VRGVDGQLRDIQEGDAIVAGGVLARVRQSEYQVKVKEAESQASRRDRLLTPAEHSIRKHSPPSNRARLNSPMPDAAYEKSKLDLDRAQTVRQPELTKANYDAAKAQFEQATASSPRRSQFG